MTTQHYIQLKMYAAEDQYMIHPHQLDSGKHLKVWKVTKSHLSYQVLL